MTKPLYTIGPSIESHEKLSELLRLMDSGIILSLRQETLDKDRKTIETIRKLDIGNGYHTDVFINIIGNEIRTHSFKDGKVFFCHGDEVTILTTNTAEGTTHHFSINYSRLHEDIQPDALICVNCGKVILKVRTVEEGRIVCVVLKGGSCSDYSTVNTPETNVRFDFLTPKDEEDLLSCCELNVDYVTVSFVRNESDIMVVRNFLNKNGGNKIKIIAKIENREGASNARGILSVSDGMMVSRGDLGVETSVVEVPIIQKRIIDLCNKSNKMSIVATHVLSSMAVNSTPTRAEVDSIFHMVQDDLSYVMLSQEISHGKFPVETACLLREVINYACDFKHQGGHAL